MTSFSSSVMFHWAKSVFTASESDGMSLCCWVIVWVVWCRRPGPLGSTEKRPVRQRWDCRVAVKFAVTPGCIAATYRTCLARWLVTLSTWELDRPVIVTWSGRFRNEIVSSPSLALSSCGAMNVKCDTLPYGADRRSYCLGCLVVGRKKEASAIGEDRVLCRDVVKSDLKFLVFSCNPLMDLVETPDVSGNCDVEWSIE